MRRTVVALVVGERLARVCEQVGQQVAQQLLDAALLRFLYAGLPPRVVDQQLGRVAQYLDG